MQSGILWNSYSMKGYCIICFKHGNNVTNIAELHREYSPPARIFYSELDYTCDVISIFRINCIVAS